MALQRFPAEEEYKRNKELSKESVNKILKWVQAQAHIPKITEEDAILFLVSCKNDLEQAQKTLNLYYTFKAQHPEIFFNKDLKNDEFDVGCAIGMYVVLPGVTDEGYKMLYTKLGVNDVSRFNNEKEFNFMLCHHDLMLYEGGAVPGWIVIYDMDDARLSLISRLKPNILKHASYYFYETCPVQLKGVHIVRPKSFIRLFLGIIRPFMSQSTLECLHVHNKVEDLYKFIPKALLPEDLGGDQETLKQMQVAANNRLLENRHILIQHQNQRSDLSLLPKKETSIWNYLWR